MLKGSPFRSPSSWNWRVLFCPPDQRTLCQSRWAEERAGEPPMPKPNPQVATTIPRDPCRRQAAATTRLRNGGGSSEVPANSCCNSAGLEYRTPWSRLTPPSCPSCLSFITGGFFPTLSTIAGSTTAEVMAAGSGEGSGSEGNVMRFREGTLA